MYKASCLLSSLGVFANNDITMLLVWWSAGFLMPVPDADPDGKPDPLLTSRGFAVDPSAFCDVTSCHDMLMLAFMILPAGMICWPSLWGCVRSLKGTNAPADCVAPGCMLEVVLQVLAFMAKQRAALARQMRREKAAKQAAMRRRVQSRKAAARHDRQQVRPNTLHPPAVLCASLLRFAGYMSCRVLHGASMMTF